MYRNSLKTWNISKNNTPSYYKRNWGLKVCGRLLFLYWKVTNNPCFTSELRARSGKKGEQKTCGKHHCFHSVCLASRSINWGNIWATRVSWTSEVLSKLIWKSLLFDAFPLIDIRQYKMCGNLPIDEEMVLLYRRSAPAQISVLCYPKNQIFFQCLIIWDA